MVTHTLPQLLGHDQEGRPTDNSRGGGVRWPREAADSETRNQEWISPGHLAPSGHCGTLLAQALVDGLADT
jgi:hypothetical protein